MISLKQGMQGGFITLLSMALSSCGTISRFLPEYHSTETKFVKDVYTENTQQSGLHCFTNEHDQDWQCENKAYPAETLSLSDVGLQEKPIRIPTNSFVEPMYSAPESKINHKSREILDKPSTFYAVQLLALSNEAALHKYANRKQLRDPLYTQIDAKGQRLYVLLLGIYADQVSAQRASQRWASEGNRSAKPWVRTLGPLQKQIVL